MDAYSIRTMGPDEVGIAIDWAAAEGWNPGLADAACFYAADAGGFLLGELDGAPAATISCVNYGDSYSFIGLYIVRSDLRGRGLGMRLWNAAIARAGDRVIGLDGVVERQAAYKKSGFSLAYRNVRYGGVAPALGAPRVSNLKELASQIVEADDASVFPAPRAAFLRTWINEPGHVARGLVHDGRLAAWGVIRPCRSGHKIGPLVADDRVSALLVLSALIADAGASQIFLDVPIPNRDAIALAEELGLAPVFEAARMYTGPIPALRLDRLYGVSTFELG